ncbi:uncharacterized protein LOC126332375 [Schistocerca gregaria]|uniref:uncharacterized protein LOC126332375 n=1 Tax=Schistocerca gregaria TaxID=7010 RepID=UPI00211E7302|nr:uncharacterized protein LOC126332375 [Schistocerca gregaria]
MLDTCLRLLQLNNTCVAHAIEVINSIPAANGEVAAQAQCHILFALLHAVMRLHWLNVQWGGGHAALVRMSHCWRCRGLHRRVRPCAGLCLNVLRGCLTQRAAELDLPWNGYVEAAERLLAAVQGRAALDDVLCALDARIAEAAAAAVERSATLQPQVKRVCGPHMWDYGVTDENTAHDGVRSNGTAFQQSLPGGVQPVDGGPHGAVPRPLRGGQRRRHRPAWQLGQRAGGRLEGRGLRLWGEAGRCWR